MEDPLMHDQQAARASFAVQENGKRARAGASAPLSGSRCLLGLLVLNLLVSSTMLIGFFVFAFSVKSQVKEMNEAMNPLTQLGLIWRTNTDLSTWKSALSTVSALADKVKDIDWAVEEPFTSYGYATCDYFNDDEAECKSFKGDEGLQCTWEGNDPASCTGNAEQYNYPTERKIIITSQTSTSMQRFFRNLKDGLDAAAAKLPTADDAKKQAAAGKTEQVCSNTPAPVSVKEHSSANVPLLVDKIGKDFPCFVQQTSDQAKMITEEKVSSIISALYKMNIINCYARANDPNCEKRQESATDTFMAYHDFVEKLIAKFTAAMDA